MSVVGPGANTGVIPISRQPPASLRAPGDDTDPLYGAERQHFPLLLAVEEVHQILHADKTSPAVAFGDPESPRELPRMHRRCADITDLSGLDVSCSASSVSSIGVP